MADDPGTESPISRRFRSIPAPVAVGTLTLVLADLTMVVPSVRDTPLRVPFAFLLAFFVPGYLVVTLLFADGTVRSHDWAVGSENQPLDAVERIVLSIGISISILLLLGLTLSISAWTVSLVSVLIGLNALVVLLSVPLLHRELSLPSRDRDAETYRTLASRLRPTIGTSRTDRVLTVVLVLSLVLALGSVAHTAGITDPQTTELYLLTENDDGKLVADEYPTAFERNETKPLVLGVENNEDRPIEYTVVVKLQRVDPTESVSVRDERKLNQFTVSTHAGQTTHVSTTVSPPIAGENLRLVYLLYKGEPPEEPTMENAYREVHLWLNVSEPS